MSTASNTYARKRALFCSGAFSFAPRLANAPDWGCEWLDTTGLVRMLKDRVARIQVTDAYASSGHFNAIDVKIVHKTNGVIDSKTFRFRDYITEATVSEAVGRASPLDRVDPFYIWADRENFEWYMATPTKEGLRNLMSAIDLYLNTFE
jgi:hypothetical protein